MPDVAQPRGLRALYAWMLKNASGPHAWAALACFAFAEASFFPIPPDVMLLPMMVADRKRAFRLGAWCAFWSVMGGMLGYAIGALFWETAGIPLIHLLHIPLAEVDSSPPALHPACLSDRGSGPDADSLQDRHHRLRPGGRALPGLHGSIRR